MPGRYNTAASFDGGDMLTLEDESDFDITGQMVLGAWVKLSSFSTPWQAIVTKGGAWGLYRYGATNNITFRTEGLSSVDLAGGTVADGKWHYVQGVFNGGVKNLYIDGNFITSQVATGSIATNDQPVTVGGDAANAGRGWVGSLDDVVIYSGTGTTDVRDGRYAAQDNVVAPGTSVGTSVTVANNSDVWPAAVSYYGETDQNYSGYSQITPYGRLGVHQPARRVRPRRAEISQPGSPSCPSAKRSRLAAGSTRPAAAPTPSSASSGCKDRQPT